MQADKTYQGFGFTYASVLTKYYHKHIADLMQTLYTEKSRIIKGIIYIDGLFQIDANILTDLFLNYSTCFVLVVCLLPEQRERISRDNVNKAIIFENISIMRYTSHLFSWILENAMERAKTCPLLICNTTLYNAVRCWLYEHRQCFRMTFSVEHLRSTLDAI